MKASEPHLCHECECDFEMLYGKGMYNGNKDSNFYCEKCYEAVFGWPFEITTIKDDDEKRTQLTNTQG